MLRRKIFLLSLLIVASVQITSAQKKKDILKMPKAETVIDEETGVITYSVTFSNDMADSILYKRAMHWYNSEIKSMRVQFDETKKSEIIVAKGEMDLLYPADKDGKQAKAYRLKYTMDTKINNQQVITRIYRFNVQNTIYTPIEPWIKEQDEDYQKKYFLLYIEEQSDQILANFKEFVNVTVYKK